MAVKIFIVQAPVEKQQKIKFLLTLFWDECLIMTHIILFLVCFLEITPTPGANVIKQIPQLHLLSF
jgi:hypothetical protein